MMKSPKQEVKSSLGIKTGDWFIYTNPKNGKEILKLNILLGEMDGSNRVFTDKNVTPIPEKHQSILNEIIGGW